MDLRGVLAGFAMEGILAGTFMARPNARPSPDKLAQTALEYADALMKKLELSNTEAPCDAPNAKPS